MSISSPPQISAKTATTYGLFLKELNNKLAEEGSSYLEYKLTYLAVGLSTLTLLVLSILAVQGVLTHIGGTYWKLGIAGVVYNSLCLTGFAAFLILLVRKAQFYGHLKKIKEAVTPSAFDKQLDCNPLKNLPLEINLIIFSNLEVKDLALTARVSKEWNCFTKYTVYCNNLLPKIENQEVKKEMEKDPHDFLCQIHKTYLNKTLIACLLKKSWPQGMFYTRYNLSKLKNYFKKIAFPENIMPPTFVSEEADIENVFN